MALALLVGACTGGESAIATTAATVPPTAPTSTSTSPPATTTTTTPVTMPVTDPSPFTSTINPVDPETLAHSWAPGCPLAPEDLSSIEITYLDFDGVARLGEVVIATAHAEAVVSVFRRLYESGYQVESIVPIGRLPLGAQDDPGYSNTSGFHCRFVEGTTRWSEHAMGRAIDINPQLNPFVRGDEIWPIGSEPYLDRSLGLPGMIIEGDVVVSAFDSIGWEWGGRWRTLKDYHHFSSTGR